MASAGTSAGQTPRQDDKGTVGYQSPEAVRSKSSDVFALCVLAAELLAGPPPFAHVPGVTSTAIRDAVRSGQRPLIPAVLPVLPSGAFARSSIAEHKALLGCCSAGRWRGAGLTRAGARGRRSARRRCGA